MALTKAFRKVEGASLVQLRNSNDKGRYITASREIRIGTIIFKEEAFSGISAANEKSESYCSNCFKEITKDPVKCFGCSDSTYCSIHCKVTAWKSSHWIECFMRDMLAKVTPDVRLSLRTLLNAAHSIYGENATDSMSLIKLIKELSEKEHEISDTKQPYSSTYWSVHCLQTHEKETSRQGELKELYGDVKKVAKVLLKCFSLHGSISQKGVNSDAASSHKRKGQNGMELILRTVFRKMAFASYYASDYFDIGMWKSFVENCCHLPDIDTLPDEKSPKDVLCGEILTERDLLEKLLFHHALQVRTNSQAVFKLCESAAPSGMQIIEQARIATCFFPITSLMNHSCSPNVTVSFDGHSITVVATNRIMKGEEICHCYGPHFSRQGVDKRQYKLRQQYFFTCQCTACAAELSDEEQASYRLQFYAFKCRYCGDPLKPDYVSDSGCETATCINVECRKQVDLRWIGLNKVKAKHEEAATLMNEGSLKDAVVSFKNCLKTAQDVLYPCHTMIGKLNDKIAQCHVLLENNMAALPHLMKSISIVGMLHGLESVEVAHELQKLTSLYFNLQHIGPSGKIAQNVLSIYKTHYRQENLFPPGADEMKKIVEICRRQ